ncbi:ABC transporter permease [Catenulispora sp. NL8]|uniref:ABC transporter permease n=1 Tax=Catenulispora pinistramenti TaxID=2705254 RepID=A0ABS5KV09_9ACTN|nr:ABC transporter permease [Catenulispora pinistramenti]MBS2549886.1 ABC transporter permease [Catenulispora pinistramenti]
MNGRTVRLVMRREFTERGRDRGFAISVAVSLLIVLVAVVISALVSNRDKTPSFTVGFAGPRAAVEQQFADQQAPVYKIKLTSSVVTDSAGAQALVKSGRLDALVDGGQIYVQDSVDPKLAPVLAGANLASQLPDLDQVQGQSTVKLAPKDPDAGQRKTVALVAEIMLFSQMIAYCMWVATGVVEEKASRVIEILLSSTSARALLTGKIIGIGALGLLQLAATAAVGIGAGSATGALHMTGQIWQTVGIVAVWFVLGYIFYAAAYAAVAARVSRQEEMQTAVQPLNLVLMVPYFAAFAALSNPDAVWVRVLSLVPPFSVLIQPVRIAGGDAAWWEPVAAIGLMAVLTVGIVAAGARVYENSVLRFGSKVPMRVAWTAGRKA